MGTETTQPRGTSREGDTIVHETRTERAKTRRQGRRSAASTPQLRGVLNGSPWGLPSSVQATVATIAVIVALFGGAGRATADELTSNLGETPVTGTPKELYQIDVAQAFTTGANVTGYQLESITIDFEGAATVIGTTGRRMTVYVYLHEDNGSGRPNLAQGGQVTTLTKNGVNFAGPTAGLNKYKVWKARCYPQGSAGGLPVRRVVSPPEPQHAVLDLRMGGRQAKRRRYRVYRTRSDGCSGVDDRQ